VVVYENNGGSSGELFARQGSHAAWSSSFRLVGDVSGGGLAVRSRPLGNAGSGYMSFIGTEVEAQMSGVSSSAYIRFPF
jgi:hypothetical protein